MKHIGSIWLILRLLNCSFVNEKVTQRFNKIVHRAFNWRDLDFQGFRLWDWLLSFH